MVDRITAERVIEEITRKYKLNVKKDHRERAIRHLMSFNLSPDSLRVVALSYLAVGESYFFRDRETWEEISKVVPSEREVKALSVGCSEGEEVYTFSFTMSGKVSFSILGLDLNEERIRRAVEGVYDSWKLREMTKREIEKYFNSVNDGFRVKDEYRSGVYFKVSNVLDEPISGTYDVILARRVLIYLNESGISKMLEKLLKAMKEEGVLVLGKGEVYWQVMERFEPFPVGEAVFWRKKRQFIPDEMEERMVEMTFPHHAVWEKIDLIKDMINIGLYEEALRWAKEAKKVKGEEAKAWKYEILALTYMGLSEEAIEVLREARKKFPFDEDIKRLEKVLT